MKNFVIVVDAQYDFMMPGGALYVPGAEHTIVPGIQFLQQLKPETTAGVLFTFDTHDAATYGSMPESQQFPIHCVKGTTGWENVFNYMLVHADIPAYQLAKGVFNMWEEPDVVIRPIEALPFEPTEADVHRDAFFDQLQESGVEEVVVIGVAADFCVSWTVRGLVDNGFRVGVPENLTVGIVRQLEQTVAEDFTGDLAGRVTVLAPV